PGSHPHDLGGDSGGGRAEPAAGWIRFRDPEVDPAVPGPLREMTVKRWYVVHAYSGFEKSVAQALRDRIVRDEMQERFGDVLVPTEEVVEMRAGQKRRSERKFFPGYVLVQI